MYSLPGKRKDLPGVSTWEYEAAAGHWVGAKDGFARMPLIAETPMRTTASPRAYGLFPLLSLGLSSMVWAQGAERPSVDAALDAGRPLALTLDQALEIALVRSYALNQSRVDVKTADKQVQEAYGTVYPQLDANVNYTRQFSQLNPFAGSSATNLGNTGLTTQFLLENEARAAAGQPPLGFEEFLVIQPDIDLSDNPFFVENRFAFGVTITQTLYDASAFAAIDGAKQLKEQLRAAFRDQARRVVRDVATAYYDVLLAKARAEVLARSEARSQQEVREARARVEQGVQPQFFLLTAEVQLANTETERLRADNDAATARDRLKVLIGVPVRIDLKLVDGLERERSSTAPELDDAMAVAFSERPDLERAELQIQLDEVEGRIAFADYLPLVELFFTAEAVGQVPDDRQPDPNFVFDPDAEPGEAVPPTEFIVAQQPETPGFFSNSFWGPNVSGGLRMRWNLFNGLQTTARVAQRRLAAQRSRFARDLLRAQIEQEVTSQLRNLRTSVDQIRSQSRNVDRAKTNYEQANARVQEGVSSQVELRDASKQLDDSRLNYLTALRDYWVAEVQYQVAIGRPPLPVEPTTEIEEHHGGSKSTD
jgi:outer membrane protein TolC